MRQGPRKSARAGLCLAAALPLGIALALLILPASAAAVPITVDNTGDSSGGACTPADGDCSLRSAIDTANALSGSDTIVFESAFDGDQADSNIAVASTLPSITTDADVSGGQCLTDAGVNGPCVGVSGPSGGFGLTVDGVDNTSISGVAVTGALTGIRLINAVSGFTATNDWFGVKLDGTAGANNTGLFVDPDSSGAQIGDGTAAGRNVFAHNNNVGLDIEGADSSTIRGNYFGVKPDGVTAAPNPVAIEITGSNNGSGFNATGNSVGGTLSAAESATPACDGPCNVIAGANAFGVDLHGTPSGQNERPAGQTTIRGNHVGFDATGNGEIPNTNVGINIGGADDVTVGGPSALDGNHIVGGKNGIESTEPNAENQLVQNNLIGLNYAGTAVGSSSVPSGSHGVIVVTQGSGEATLTQNRIAGGMDDAIETIGSPAVVTANLIGVGTGGQVLQGGLTGIDAVIGSGPNGVLVSNNLIQNSTVNGLELQGADGLTAVGNTITGSGAAGVALKIVFGTTHSDNNTIGGDTPLEENVISGSNGPAVEVVEPVSAGNVIARNTGQGNTGPFIDLGADGLGNSMSGPNGGIQAPSVASAFAASASGTAQPGATVRVFSKATADNGEIAGFLGSAVADGSGNWQVSYAGPQPAGSPIGATQTTSLGTSEMAVAITAAGTGSASDTDDPQTKLKKTPPKRSEKTTVKFRFVSDEPGSTFACKLDRRKFRPCKSPKRYRNLKPGRHTFRVKAMDPAGNVDDTPAKFRFKVLPSD